MCLLTRVPQFNDDLVTSHGLIILRDCEGKRFKHLTSSLWRWFPVTHRGLTSGLRPLTFALKDKHLKALFVWEIGNLIRVWFFIILIAHIKAKSYFIFILINNVNDVIQLLLMYLILHIHDESLTLSTLWHADKRLLDSAAILTADQRTSGGPEIKSPEIYM